ncbi:hypothetical protein F5X71_14585 [Nocardia brasiliensis]|uniref:O-acyltransferase WSD1-like N-terminal domain-containing protein n=1 Tax=Nocardia brasiliensis TaxID=37326 RepID=A0A6G9XR37_NOCBR|nr:hypothetical protein F5X71_14585 [Nocardia brasiliensis]
MLPSRGNIAQQDRAAGYPSGPQPEELTMGRKTEASPLDALLYHDRTMCIGLVLHLTGRAPTPDRLASHVRDRLDRLPALSVIVSGSGTAATWLRRSPELGYHVRSRDLSAGADIYDVVRELHREPFAEGRPPWTMTILDGHIPGEYLIFYRVSHGVQDIGGITRTLEILSGTHRSTRPIRTPQCAAWSNRRGPGCVITCMRSGWWQGRVARPRYGRIQCTAIPASGRSNGPRYRRIRCEAWPVPMGEALMTPICPASRGSYRSGRHGITRTPTATRSRFRWRSTTGDPRTSVPPETNSPSGV